MNNMGWSAHRQDKPVSPFAATPRPLAASAMLLRAQTRPPRAADATLLEGASPPTLCTSASSLILWCLTRRRNCPHSSHHPRRRPHRPHHPRFRLARRNPNATPPRTIRQPSGWSRISNTGWSAHKRAPVAYPDAVHQRPSATSATTSSAPSSPPRAAGPRPRAPASRGRRSFSTCESTRTSLSRLPLRRRPCRAHRRRRPRCRRHRPCRAHRRSRRRRRRWAPAPLGRRRHPRSGHGATRARRAPHATDTWRTLASLRPGSSRRQTTGWG